MNKLGDAMDNLEERVLQYLRAYQHSRGQPPTIQEIVNAIPELRHRSTAFYAIQRLLRRGKVKTTKEKAFRRRYSSKE